MFKPKGGKNWVFTQISTTSTLFWQTGIPKLLFKITKNCSEVAAKIFILMIMCILMLFPVFLDRSKAIIQTKVSKVKILKTFNSLH